MEPDLVRLECLRLCNRHDLDPKAVVDRAKEYETFVAGGKGRPKPVTAADAKTKDNPLA